jgi:hypothetical protein
MSGDPKSRAQDGGHGPGAGPEVGSVAEEAAKLLGALSDWAQDAGLGPGQHAHEHLATGAPECTWGPICRTVHAVRQIDPAVRAQLADAVTTVVHTVAEVVRAAAAPPRRSGAGGVEHIDLAEEWPDQEWPEDEWPDDDRPMETDPEEGDR